MTQNKRTILALSTFLAASLATTSSDAQADSQPPAEIQAIPEAVQVDVEIDPLAYALGGYSLHSGLTYKGFRLDLGAFALDAPEFLHGNEGLDVYASGFGAKLDYYPSKTLVGFVVGGMLSHGRETVTHRATTESSTSSHTTVGARIGYRIPVVSGFYALPWVGIDYSLSDRKHTVAGVDYDPGRVLFFPTVHIGKKF